MKEIRLYSEGFKLNLEKFIIGCDALEETRKWDKTAYGEMEAYYQNSLLCVMVKLISADGKFSEREVDFVNGVFGFEYTAQELRDVYCDSEININSALDVELKKDMDLLKEISVELAIAYKELLIGVCDIVIECDGYIDNAEIDIAEKLKERLGR